MNPAIEKLVESMRKVAGGCDGYGAEVWALTYLRAWAYDAQAGLELGEVLEALDIVKAEKRAP